jgi:hypothetical protein
MLVLQSTVRNFGRQALPIHALVVFDAGIHRSLL